LHSIVLKLHITISLESRYVHHRGCLCLFMLQLTFAVCK